MAYVKTTWETGDVITAEKLNNIESGIEAHDPFIITESEVDSVFVLDKTWQEIYDAFSAGKYCQIFNSDGETAIPRSVVIAVQNILGSYQLATAFGVNQDGTVTGDLYTAQSADDYPERNS